MQHIFQQYILGASYSELVDHLREQDIPYDQDKLWNKNMVARILENRKYIGQEDWPVIIEAEQYDCAAEKRSSKVTLPKKTEAQKLLRRLSGGGTAKDLEQHVMYLLNRLIANPELLRSSPVQPPDPFRVSELRTALEQELDQQSINEGTAKRLAMELAAAQYEALGNQEYETERLRRLFMRVETMQELDSDILRSSVSAIHVTGTAVSIRLKNDQIIERRNLS